LEPDRLAPAVVARYGKDRTFSVPILTLCALAGRLGTGRDAWRHVIPLPFELAACPPGWFAALRLPVVSYALPALIAIGQPISSRALAQSLSRV
jgi:squalene-hopene/tetraprenyl-beta-curcumene cyclase